RALICRRIYVFPNVDLICYSAAEAVRRRQHSISRYNSACAQMTIANNSDRVKEHAGRHALTSPYSDLKSQAEVVSVTGIQVQKPSTREWHGARSSRILTYCVSRGHRYCATESSSEFGCTFRRDCLGEGKSSLRSFLRCLTAWPCFR